jgi:molybdopterin synthase catalytic subunit
MIQVRIQEAAFDPGSELSSFESEGAGAVVTFTGVVRGGEVTLLEIEHYPGMTEAAIQVMVDEACERFGLTAVRVIHRYGRLRPNEPIMMVMTAAPHRRAAFDAADFLMDWLKSRAPFWKREHTNGRASWVEAKPDDEAALGRWHSGP